MAKAKKYVDPLARRRWLANLIGAKLPEDIKQAPEDLGLLTPHTVEVLAAASGLTVGQLLKNLVAESRLDTTTANRLDREIARMAAESAARRQDAAEKDDAIHQVKFATGKR